MSSETQKPLTEKANAAFRRAAAKVIERARRTGTPVIVWEQGLVRELSVEELERQHSAGGGSSVPRVPESEYRAHRSRNTG
jgi:hypothetical protein